MLIGTASGRGTFIAFSNLWRRPVPDIRQGPGRAADIAAAPGGLHTHPEPGRGPRCADEL